MDGHDRKELSAAAMSRQEWLNKYGSFLFCPERDTLCVHMDGMWMTGCERPQCILDDPEYQILQKRIEANREAADAAARKERKKEEKSAPIRNQKNFIQSHKDRMMDEIHRLEEASQEAFWKNKPNLGQQLFNRANIKRQELREWQEKKKERVKDDQQSNREDHRRDDEDGRSACPADRGASDRSL